MKTFKEWLNQNKLEKKIIKQINNSNKDFCFFESFDSHYDITKIYENKKFRVYLRLMQQISNKLLPNSTISHNDKEIHIYKLPRENVIKLKEIDFKYKPKQ